MKLLTFCSHRDTAEAVARLLTPHAEGIELIVRPDGGRYAVWVDTDGRIPRPLVEALRALRTTEPATVSEEKRTVEEALDTIQKRLEERARFLGTDKKRREMWNDEEATT